MCVLLPAGLSAQLHEKWGVPGSPTGRAIAAVLEMIERGDEGFIRSMVEEQFDPEFAASFPMDAHVAFFTGLHDRFPDVEPQGLMRTPEGAALGVAGSNGQRARIQVTVTEDGRIGGIQVQEPDGPGAEPELPLAERLQAWEASGDFSGVVHRTREGRPGWSGAYGEADRSSGVPNTVDTRFNIGSLTKAFTGAVILLLWEEGRLGLDDPIGRHLDGFPAEVARSVTIRHLLMHRSGWEHYWQHDHFREKLASLRSVADYMEFIPTIPLDFEPGTQRQYSNVGFEVLGAVIEAVTGRSYYDVVQERIFDPVGMKDSGFFERDRPTPRRAIGYTDRHPFAGGEPGMMENTYLLAPKGTPAGGSYSTAADLARFWFALLDYRLLSETSSHMVMGDYEEGQPAPGGPNAYGGGGPGVRALVVLLPGRRSIDVVLSNIDSPVTERIGAILEAEG